MNVKLQKVKLDDKYDLTKNQIFVSGTQAIVRLLLMQQELDRRNGLNTAGFVSGYRGSPIGGLDFQLEQAAKHLKPKNIIFQPGLNEELAATAIWGAQQSELDGMGKFDGVFGLWYGKGPGVDRTGDVFRHANIQGSSKFGGALALMGDDHTAESSTNAHQTEFNFVDTMIPILHPAGVQEIIDYGLYGYALSRFAGTWAAIKCVKDNIESTASVDAGLTRLGIVIPEFEMPVGGLNIRQNDIDFLGQEDRMHDYKRAAIGAFIRANKLNRIIFSGGNAPKVGILTIGKSYLDVRQALGDIGIDEARANKLGIRLMKVACPWPFDLADMEEFVTGLDLVIVVEEKRSLLETQMREALYGTRYRPVIVGKKDEHDNWLFPIRGALDPNDIAVGIGERLFAYTGFHEDIDQKVKRIRQLQAMLKTELSGANRTPYFCSGCPHNSSTVVPEGSIAAAGIGCHFMSLWMDRSTIGFTQMGGEGAQWVGQQPFSKRNHIFQNLGDGTYNHSGILALRFALAGNVNITYKILYNDAVAMTGGQAHEGGLSVDVIAREVSAAGVERIALVTDDVEKYSSTIQWPKGMTIDHRENLNSVQKELRDVPGVSVLLYDQTCAAEKRRRRKRGTFPDPNKRVFINSLVCEGCGDCGLASNCVAIQPKETEFGRKRKIDQSSCNKDFRCLEGFCPSFVTVHGAVLKKAERALLPKNPLSGVPDAQMFDLEKGWASIITGVGGTGVVTIGAVLGMAAHLENKGCGMIDMAGLAQKGGAVSSHVRIAKSPKEISAIRVSAGKADLILGCDIVVSASQKVLASMRENETLVVVNTAEVLPGDFTRDRTFELSSDELRTAISRAAGDGKSIFVDATKIATKLFGNSIAANMFMLGFAFQKDALPLKSESIEKAIELNGQAVSMNIDAFQWGRKAAWDMDSVLKIVDPSLIEKTQLKDGLDTKNFVAQRVQFLNGYQDAAYGQRFIEKIEKISSAEILLKGKEGKLTELVTQYLFKLMAIKDEYEVARLYANGEFLDELNQEFESWDSLEFHLAPPILGKKNTDGLAIKSIFGNWMMGVFNALQRTRFLRGTMFDVFSYTAERKAELRLLADYERVLECVESNLTHENYQAACTLVSYPEAMLGFGRVKEKNIEAALKTREAYMHEFRELCINELDATELNG